MDKLVIPKGCELAGEIQSIINTGDIEIRTQIGANRLVSKEGSVTYEVQGKPINLKVVEAAQEVSISASELHCGQVTAKTIAVTADVLEIEENLIASEDLALVCGEIRAKEIGGQILTIKANSLKAERIEGEQVEITVGSATLKEIKAKRVVLAGVVQCNRILADELVQVESGRVAIRNVTAPCFLASPKVSGIVMVATCDDVKAEGVRGFLHPSEIDMLSGDGLMEVAAPTVPVVTTADLDATDPDVGAYEESEETSDPTPPVAEEPTGPALNDTVEDEFATRDLSAIAGLSDTTETDENEEAPVLDATAALVEDAADMADTFSEPDKDEAAEDPSDIEFSEVPELTSVDLEEETADVPGPELEQEVAELPSADLEEEVAELPSVDLEEEVAELPSADLEEEMTELPSADFVEDVSELPSTDFEEEVAELPSEDLEEEVTELPSADFEEEVAELPNEDLEEGDEITELPNVNFSEEPNFEAVGELPSVDFGEEPDFEELTDLPNLPEDLEDEFEEIGELPSADFDEEPEFEEITELAATDFSETENSLADVEAMPESNAPLGEAERQADAFDTSPDFGDDEEEDIVSVDDLESFEPGIRNEFPHDPTNAFTDINTQDAIQVNTDDFTDVDELDEIPEMSMGEPDTLVEEELYDLDGSVEEDFEEMTDVFEEEAEDLEELGDEELSDPMDESLAELPPELGTMAEEDPETALIANLNEILDQIRGFFPEDNKPQSIGQIRKYLENRQLNLFQRARNRESVIKNFQKFQHEEINELVDHFFEMMDTYFNSQNAQD